MQIRDMLGQYSQNVKNGTEELMSAQGTQKLVSSMQELEPGSTFEGTVNSVKNGKVVLALGNGQTITARLDGKVSIQPGESMFFQVRSNDGTTIALRPYVQAGNIIIRFIKCADCGWSSGNRAEYHNGGFHDERADVDQQTEHP